MKFIAGFCLIYLLTVMTIVRAQDVKLDLTLDTGKEYAQEVTLNKGSMFIVKLLGKSSGTGFQWLTHPSDLD